MTRLLHTKPGVWPERREGRLAAGVRSSSPEGCRLALLGLPDDTGVRLNGGRPGAAQGPQAFRQALGRFGTAWDGLTGTPLDPWIYDAGDVVPADGNDEGALTHTHERVEAVVAQLQGLGLCTVCIGGGHDLSLPSLSALGRLQGALLGGINLDAHLDVRERVGSGMPFRQLIERGVLDPRRFVELGLGRFANDRADLDWLGGLGARLVFCTELHRAGLDLDREFDAALAAGAGFVSIDLDALDQAIAPGVSAPNPLGVSVSHATELAERAGSDPRVLHFDLMELNPAHDREGHTARVAALLFLHFCAGFQRRPR